MARLALHTAAGFAATLAFAWAPALQEDDSGPGHLETWSLGAGQDGNALIRHSFSADFIEIIGMQRASIPTGFEDGFPKFFDRTQPERSFGGWWANPGDKAREIRGWPWRCCTADYHFVTGSGDPTVTGGLRLADGIRGVNGFRYGRVLPLTPRWGGLLFDVALFATVSAALSTAFATLRKRRRSLRGLCPTCRYDLRGLPPGTPCPECGPPPPPLPAGEVAEALRGRRGKKGNTKDAPL